MSRPDCSDVCEVIHIWMNELGFNIDPENEDHSDMLEALSNCKLVKEENLVIDIEDCLSGALSISENLEEFKKYMKKDLEDFISNKWNDFLQWKVFERIEESKKKE